MMRKLTSSVHVLVVPYPAQGHVTPLLELSHKLVDHGVKVTFVNTESIHNKLVSRLPPEEADGGKCNRLRFVSVPNRVLEDMGIEQEASDHLEKLIRKINEDNEEEMINCVIADFLVWWALEVAEKLGIKRAAFSPAAMVVMAMSLHIPTLLETGIIDENGTPLKHEMIRLSPGMHEINIDEFNWNHADIPFVRKVIFELYSGANKAAKYANWILCNSFQELEPAACDLSPNILTIGPLSASTNQDDHPVGHFWTEDSTCLTWLDQQPVNSVIYIAFGSITTLSQEQFNELTNALKVIGRPFLCVVRPGLNAGSTDAYPDGLREKGKIVDWAPQQKVLAHPSIACFLTHCGWNSVMETLAVGVPFLCWPHISDQFHNSTYICDIWKVGLKLNKDESGIISRNEIKSKVEQLIGDEGIRTRVLEMKEMTRKSVSEGGSSWKNFKVFIEALKC